MPAPLQFHFDFISPYGFLASREVEALAARHGRAVEWNAMLLGVSVMKVMGLKPLLETPLKGEYTRRDVARRFRLLAQRPKRAPDARPMNPLAAGRAFCWVKQQRPELAAPLAHAIYDAYWMQGLDLSTPREISAIALPPGIDAAWLEEGAQSSEASALLRASVEASLAAGIFGSPTLVVDGEPFWGVDALPAAEAWLARGGW